MIVYLALGAIFGAFGAYAYRLMPDKWLCDYGEAPTEIHSAQNRKLKAIYYLLFAAVSAFATMLAARDAVWTQSVFTAPLCCVLLMISVADAQYGILPNELMIIALIVGLPSAFRAEWYRPLLGALLSGGICFAMLFIAGKIFKKDAVGMGDVRLAALAGFVCGYGALVPMAVTSICSAALCFAVQMARHKLTMKSQAAFGPYLVFGILFSLCLKNEWQMVVNWYFHLLGI